MDTQIAMRDAARLKPARYNPETRTTTKNLKFLLESMRRYGFLSEFPIITDPHGHVIDGHRRLACAKLLGIKRVPCVVSNINPADLWGEICQDSRPLSPTEAGVAYLHGLDPLPTKHAKKVGDFIALAGQDTFEYVVNNGYSYTILAQAKGIANFCNKSSEDGFVRKTLYWLIKHRMQYLVRSAITHNFATPRGLAERIEADAPLQVM